MTYPFFRARIFMGLGLQWQILSKFSILILFLKITSFTKPTADVAVNPGQGLTLSLSGAGVSATGEWRYKYRKAFIKIRDHGSFSASADGVSISVSVSLGKNDNGSPRIAATGCHCSISDVHIKLSGGASWLYNIFIRWEHWFCFHTHYNQVPNQWTLIKIRRLPSSRIYFNYSRLIIWNYFNT